MEFFKTTTIEDGRNEIASRLKKYEISHEEVDILESRGRILYEEIISRENIPGFNRSTVDGYAVNSKDSHGASSTIPSMLSLVESVEMGNVPKKSIERGQTSYVPTGGMIPDGSDSVVMIENAEKLDEENIMIYKAVSKGQNVIFKGDDISEGETVLPKGKRITSHDIGVLATQGLSKVKVYRKLKVAIISTGDEIVDLDEPFDTGKIRDINGYVLSARVIELGAEVERKAIVKDEFELLKNEVGDAIERADIVIVSGGSSVGAKDYTYEVINSFGGEGVFIHGVAVKPGKPTIVGMAGEKIVFGLPGHPSSSILLFNIFVKEAMKNIYGTIEVEKSAYCKMDSNFPSSSGKKTYQMVSVYEADGEMYARPVFGKSGMITLLSKADGYIEIEPHEEGIYSGEKRKVIYF
jgi:molybdopterin molybdotransferase